MMMLLYSTSLFSKLNHQKRREPVPFLGADGMAEGKAARRHFPRAACGISGR